MLVVNYSRMLLDADRPAEAARLLGEFGARARAGDAGHSRDLRVRFELGLGRALTADTARRELSLAEACLQRAERLLTGCTRVGKVPEPLRLAHLIGGGVKQGQSGRRA